MPSIRVRKGHCYPHPIQSLYCISGQYDTAVIDYDSACRGARSDADINDRRYLGGAQPEKSSGLMAMRAMRYQPSQRGASVAAASTTLTENGIRGNADSGVEPILLG
ncbi:hypothetical protein [Mycobacterium uberis]|uniref:hypothetical protein n=1 Tax=Mycobacterium uberis TaxID=2162698 RepID=UPI000E300FDA|nr:hypothetical protein [Mycobacterium uberis]